MRGPTAPVSVLAAPLKFTAPPAVLGALVGTVQFEVGGTYDIAVYDGQVSMCGYSGPATGRTADLFEKAFLR